MSGETHNSPQDRIEQVVKSADKNADRILSEEEKKLPEAIQKKAKELAAILDKKDPYDPEKIALQKAIFDICKKYKGLSSADIYVWIADGDEEKGKKYFFESLEFFEIINAPLLKVNIFKRNIQIKMLPGIDQAVVEETFKVLGKRLDLEKFITDKTVFELKPDGRIHFSINNGHQDIKYYASQYEVLRVVQEKDPKRQEKVKITLAKIDAIADQLEAEFKKDTSITSEQRKLIEAIAKYGVDGYAHLAGYSSDKDIGKILASPKYYPLLESIRRLIDESSQTARTVLVDDDPLKTAQVNATLIDEDIDEERPSVIHQNAPGIRKTLQNGKLKNHTEYEAATDKIKKTVQYYPDGKLWTELLYYTGTDVVQHETVYNAAGKKSQESEFDEKGKLLKTSHFDESGKIICRTTIMLDGSDRPEMVDDDGTTFGIFDGQSEDKFISMLALKLNTHEKLAIFFEIFMEYVHDSDDPKNPLKRGTPEKHGEYWQTWRETLRRREKYKHPGDCDDVAFFAEEILKRQGKNPQVMMIPGHALCIWAEKRPNGRYDAYSLCTFGIDKNGNRLGMKQDPIKEKGYETLQEAVNSILEKYQEEGKGLEKGVHYSVTDHMDVGYIPKIGERKITSLPIEILIDPEFRKLQTAVNTGKFSDIEKAYLELVAKYPGKKYLHEDLYKLYRSEIGSLFLDKKIDNNDPRVLELYEKQIPQMEIVMAARADDKIFSEFRDAYIMLKQEKKLQPDLEKWLQKQSSNPYRYLNVMNYHKSGNNFKAVNDFYKKMRTECANIPKEALLEAINILKSTGNFEEIENIQHELFVRNNSLLLD